MDSERPMNTGLCPLCGGPNHCAVTADPSATACWCEFEEFPRELLDKVPTSAVRRVCICKKCLVQYREANKAGDSYL